MLTANGHGIVDGVISGVVMAAAGGASVPDTDDSAISDIVASGPDLLSKRWH